MNKNNRGFTLIEIVVALFVVTVIAGAGFFVLNKNSNKNSSNSSSASSKSGPKMKNIGFNIDYYNSSTNKAGDFEFTKEIFDSGIQMLFMDYGSIIPATSAGPERSNPQPTFILPLGTKVLSMVDGVVYDVPKLYSDDYSIQVQPKGSDLIFETEHVINPLVKKGDQVKAGDVIAEVSDYDKKAYAGLGLFEIGILKGGNPPSHVCPFDYLDDSIKAETLKKITAVKKSWEVYRGDKTIYDESGMYIEGCITSKAIEG